MCDVSFDTKLFETFQCGTPLDDLLSSHVGLPRGVNYMIIGDPGVGKTTIILDLMAEEMIPYEALCKSYRQAGVYDPQKERITKGEGTVWDAYNVLTEFATHTTLWGAQDHKRISLMNKATTMLRKKPGIVSYIEI